MQINAKLFLILYDFILKPYCYGFLLKVRNILKVILNGPKRTMILHWNQEEAEFHSRICKVPLPFMLRNKTQWLGHRWEPQLTSDEVTQTSSPVRSVCTISSARPLVDEQFLNCSLQASRLQRYTVLKNQHCLFSLT